ncbi:hypothetical protein MTO96_027336 [Rhipicephalus appendiculatus]
MAEWSHDSRPANVEGPWTSAISSRVERILLGGKAVEVAAYVAASEDTCKGVVRGINPDLSEADLTEMVVNRRNPEALGVRRIKRTPTIAVLFEGQKVPKHVYFEGVRYP